MNYTAAIPALPITCSCLLVLAPQPSRPLGHAWLSQLYGRPWLLFLGQFCMPTLAAVGWGCEGTSLPHPAPLPRSSMPSPHSPRLLLSDRHVWFRVCVICEGIFCPLFPGRCAHLKAYIPWPLGALPHKGAKWECPVEFFNCRTEEILQQKRLLKGN